MPPLLMISQTQRHKIAALTATFLCLSNTVCTLLLFFKKIDHKLPEKKALSLFFFLIPLRSPGPMVLLRMEAPLTFPTSSTDLLLMAASRVQGMLVAPRTRTPLLSLPTPCICTRNSVLMRLADSDSFSLREPHKASTSSMKMMLGWLSRASSNSVLTSL